MMDTNNTPFDDSVTDAELLITRLIDHEATTEDRQAFEALAAAEPSHWRQLARRLEDMALLRSAVDDATNDAAASELNELVLQSRERSGIEAPIVETGWHPRGSGVRWAISSLGWAAAVVFAIFWQLNTSTSGPGDVTSYGVTPVAIAEESFEEYLDGPFALSQFQPVLQSTEVMDDGRVIVEFVRRIEEVIIVDSEAELPASIDSINLAQLRRSMPNNGWMTEEEHARELRAEELFQLYLKAPYVVGEYQPSLLDVQEIDGGRYMLRLIRRVGEVAVFNSADEVPVLADGQLVFDPSEFRRTQQNQPVS